jgi:hypothetical protein
MSCQRASRELHIGHLGEIQNHRKLRATAAVARASESASTPLGEQLPLPARVIEDRGPAREENL